MTRWAIVTGDYPPHPGGVSDYTQLVAEGLAALGDSVHVYASAIDAPECPSHVAIERLQGGFGFRGLRRLRESLTTLRPDRILLQYVPHAFGWKGMNVAMVAELCRAAQDIAPLSVMFHEVMFPIESDQPWKHAILARTNRWMARRLATAAEHVYVSVPAWTPLLSEIAPDSPPTIWSPIVSNIPANPDSAKVATLRETLGAPATGIIGHFGTLGQGHGELFVGALADLLRDAPHRRALIIGRDGPEFCRRLRRERPEWSDRLMATGELSAEDVAVHIVACDILLQPFIDGLTSRRGSAMACLATGTALVSNRGASTEDFWSDEFLALAESPDARQLAAKAAELLGNPERRRSMGDAGGEFYHRTFGIRRILADLYGTRREIPEQGPASLALDHAHGE